MSQNNCFKFTLKIFGKTLIILMSFLLRKIIAYNSCIFASEIKTKRLLNAKNEDSKTNGKYQNCDPAFQLD